MRRAAALLPPTLRDLAPRLLGLIAFAALFLVSGALARTFLIGPEGRVEIGGLLRSGGYPLASGLLLLGWLLGRFPVIAVLVLAAGLFSRDRAEGWARLYYARPVAPLAIYGLRLLLVAALAFALSAVVMPAFDLLMLGRWAGWATLVLAAANIAVYGGLTALLSVWTRADAWITLLLALAALVWNAVLRAGIAVPPGPRELITFVLPPQGAILQLESAFGSLEPIPWTAFWYTLGYGAVALALAWLSLRRREV